MIEIFGFDKETMYCPNCMKAVKFCEDNGYEYKFHSVISGIERGQFVRDIDVCTELMDRMGIENTDKVIVPKIFVDGEYIGGVTDMKNHFKCLQN
jgi:glutaredoxin